MTKLTQADRDKAITDLRAILAPGETVYTTLRHQSRSGMLRVIDCHVIQGSKPRWIGYLVAKAIGYGYDDRHNGLRVGGCGMDMGFHVVHTLSSILFPGGFMCIGGECPSNDHSNGMPREHRFTAETCPGKPCGSTCDHKGIPPVQHSSGGYALRPRWL